MSLSMYLRDAFEITAMSMKDKNIRKKFLRDLFFLGMSPRLINTIDKYHLGPISNNINSALYSRVLVHSVPSIARV